MPKRKRWYDKIFEFIYNNSYGCKTVGNYGIVIKRNDADEKEYIFTYYGSDIVVLNKDKGLLTINNFGYSKGRTPQAISYILREYLDDDYDVCQINGTNSNY